MELKMAEELGFVSSVGKDGQAQVVTDRKDACASCGAKHCCVSFGGNSEIVVKARNTVGAKVGDLVSVSIGSGTVIKGAAALYLIPVVGLVLGVLIANAAGAILSISETAATMSFGFGGFILGFIVTVFISRRMSARDELTPMITRIIKPSQNNFQ
jgi:sigma-E factor negative regulatory protein RseC